MSDADRDAETIRGHIKTTLTVQRPTYRRRCLKCAAADPEASE